MKTSKNIKEFTFFFNSMASHCEILLYSYDELKAYNCFDDIKKNTLFLEKKYNFYDTKSYLSKNINFRKRNKIKIDNQTLNILKEVKEISSMTDNIFDISIGTIKNCYEKTTINDIEFCLNSLKNKLGYKTWSLEKNILKFQYKQTKLDLGGVIKEYAVDKAGEIVRSYGIKSALINFGGDILAVGSKPDNQAFCIGIKNPKDPKEHLLYIDIINQALTTSANYERRVFVENQEIPHIIPTKKISNDIISSTIITNSALKSGIFSTSFMINPSCKIYDDMKVVLIDKNLNLHQNLG